MAVGQSPILDYKIDIGNIYFEGWRKKLFNFAYKCYIGPITLYTFALTSENGSRYAPG